MMWLVLYVFGVITMVYERERERERETVSIFALTHTVYNTTHTLYTIQYTIYFTLEERERDNI